MAGRAADRLRNHPSLGVEHATGQILAFAHDGAESGADQRILLLVGNRQKTVPDHFERNGVNDFIFHRPTRLVRQ